MADCKAIVIIPIYNEKDVIADTIVEVLQQTQYTPHFQVEILVFDSHSTDGSAELVQQLAEQEPRLHFTAEAQKSGLGSAYHQAFVYAMDNLAADVVFEFDADGSHQPKYLAPMLAAIHAGADVVVGSRYVPGGSIPADWGFHRKLLSVAGNWVARSVLTPKYKDFTSGFRATRTSVLRRVLPKKFMSNNYAYKLQLFWLLHKAKAKIQEFPIEFIDRDKGYSKFPRNNMWESLHVVLTLRFRTLKRFMAMCVVGGGGVIVQFTLYNACRHFAAPVPANIIATECAIIFNFLFNNWLTFRSVKQQGGALPWVKKFAKFNFCSLGSLLLQVVWIFIATHFFNASVLLENIFVGCGILLGSMSNYFLYSKWVWRQPKTKGL